MLEFNKFLSRLGGLHDCTVTLLEWRPEQNKISFDIEDLYFNFEGLPEYRGPLAGQIAFEGVEYVTIDFRDLQAPLRVNEFAVEQEGSAIVAVSVTFWPAGKIRATCREAFFPDIPLP